MGLHCLRCVLLSHMRKFCTAVGSVPRITMPHNVVNRIDRVKAKASAKKHQTQRFYKGPLIISCKRKEFNHYKGQTYSNFSPQHLAAGGWKHRKSVGDYFTVNAFDGNPAITKESHINFSSLGLNAALIKGLEQTGMKTPTNIQALTIPHMMEGKNLMCAAETGSGKTCAFLLPILHKIQMYKKRFGWTKEMNSPYAVILTPARELSDQIHSVVMSLAPYTNCSSDVICGGRGTQKILRNPPELTSDIIVSTPGVFSKLLTNKIFSTERMMHIVLDEADTLFDDSFSELSLRIIRKLKITSEKLEGAQSDSDVVGMQIAMVGATMPRNLDNVLGDVVPSDTIETVTTTSLHRLMPHVPQKFIRLSTEKKQEELLKFLKGKGQLPSLVFCNKSSTANFVGHFLTDNGISNEVFHSNMPQQVRDGRYDRLQDGSTNVLVATDIASRGLDTLRVQHVVNYDFPHFISDYIHRVGRVGRVGSHGASFVLSFVTHQWDVDLLWKIEAAARRMTELQNVNANIKRKLTGVIGKKYNHETKNDLSL